MDHSGGSRKKESKQEAKTQRDAGTKAKQEPSREMSKTSASQISKTRQGTAPKKSSIESRERGMEKETAATDAEPVNHRNPAWVTSTGLSLLLPEVELVTEEDPKKSRRQSKVDKSPSGSHISKGSSSHASKYRSFHSKTDNAVITPREEYLSKEIKRLTEKLPVDDAVPASKMRTATISKEHPVSMKLKDGEPQETKTNIDMTGAVRATVSKVWKRIGSRDPCTAKNVELNPRQQRIRRCTTSLVLLTLFLIVAGVITLVVLKSHLGSDVKIYCRSPQCIRLKDDMESMLSKTIHPCDDFYSFVCGPWSSRTNVTGFLEERIRAFNERITASFLSPLSTQPDRYGMHVLVKLYTACEQFVSGKAPPLTETIEYTNKFLNLPAVLQARSLSELFQHLIRLSLTMEIHTTFSLQFRKTGETQYLYMSVGTNIQGKLHEIVTDVFGTDQVASLSIDDMKTYIRTVLTNIYERDDIEDKAEILATVDNGWNSSSAQHPTDNYQAFRELSVMVGNYSLDKLLEMINCVVPSPLRLRLESTIRVRGFDIIKRIREYMSKANITVTTLYYAVHVLSDVLQYTRVQADVTTPGAISTVCLKMTQTSLTHTWPYLVGRLAGYRGSPAWVLQMVHNMRSLATYDVLLRGVESYTRREIVTALTKLQFRLYSESELDELGPDVNYTSLEPEKKTFVSAYLSSRAFEARLLQRKLPTRETFMLAEHQFRSNLSNAKPLPLLMVPIAFQGPPVFYFNRSDDIPVYFNYATLGLLTAKEIVRYLKPVRSWDGKSKQRHEKYIACLKTLRESIGLGPVKKSDDDAWSDNILNWVYGARYANETTRLLLQKDGDRAFSINWPAAQRVFFVRSCLPSCTSLSSDSPVLPRERCLLPALVNEGFSTHFQCAQRPGFRIDRCVSSMFKAVD